MENSSPNPSSSACDIRIQKRLAECFAKSFPQKICEAYFRRRLVIIYFTLKNKNAFSFLTAYILFPSLARK